MLYTHKPRTRIKTIALGHLLRYYSPFEPVLILIKNTVIQQNERDLVTKRSRRLSKALFEGGDF